MEITGTIKNAIWHQREEYPVIYGEIFGDVNSRWPDGTKIYTSTVQESMGDGVFRTRNSVYKVEFQEGETIPADLPTRDRVHDES